MLVQSATARARGRCCCCAGWRRLLSGGARGQTSLVSAGWLGDNLARVKVLDSTWFLVPVHGPRNADAEFLERRIPGAQRFDLDALADPHEKELPHMLPPFEWFGERMDAMGVSPLDEIVVYDTLGQFSAARGWWTLHTLGAVSPKLLDGGLPKWIKEGGRLASGPVSKPSQNPPGTWAALTKPRLDRVVSTEDVLAFATTREESSSAGGEARRPTQMVDARPANRFLGIDPEPRPNLKKGRIPHSLNLPFKECLRADGTFKDRDELRRIFTDLGVDLSGSTTVYTTCGSGTTAAVVSFALEQLLGVDAPLYDASFAFWGRAQDARPVV